MAKQVWDERCVCVSFVNQRCRCDRRAQPNGRCAKHNEPMHLSKREWTSDGAPRFNLPVIEVRRGMLDSPHPTTERGDDLAGSDSEGRGKAEG
jgi:hypothetical protein